MRSSGCRANSKTSAAIAAAIGVAVDVPHRRLVKRSPGFVGHAEETASPKAEKLSLLGKGGGLNRDRAPLPSAELTQMSR